jgi:hypothetical protein
MDIYYTIETQNLENIKWLLENGFPYSRYSYGKLIEYGLLEH